MTELRIHKKAPKPAQVLIVNARYGDLDLERRLLAPNHVVGVSAADAGELRQHVLEHHPDAMIVGSRPQVPAAVIEEMTQCRVIVRYGVGVDNIDVDEAARAGMVVANVRDYCTDEVSSHALLLVLSCARALPLALHQVRLGHWGVGELGDVRRLEDLTIGIIGFGAIGRALAEKLVALGLTVVATDPWVSQERFAERGVKMASLSELLAISDVVSINSPLTEDTAGLIGMDEFAQMKPGAFLVNTARAEIVQESAFLKALNEGHLAGAALDVLWREPPSADEVLLAHPSVLVTPHAGWYSTSAVEDLRRGAVEQVVAALSGRRPRYAL